MSDSETTQEITKYFIQYSSLFDSMDFSKVEGGYYTILTTNNLQDIWDKVEVMREKMETYQHCHGMGNTRIFIARFKKDDDKTFEVVFNDDYAYEKRNEDKTLQTVSEEMEVERIEEYITYAVDARLTELDDSEGFPSEDSEPEEEEESESETEKPKGEEWGPMPDQNGWSAIGNNAQGWN